MISRLLNPKHRPAAIIIAGMTLYSILLCWSCHAAYAHYLYDDFDLAIDAQTLWNMCHGSADSSIHGIVFLGNHMRLVLFLLVPIYALIQTPLLLLYLQSLALASGSWAVFLLARDRLPARWAVLLGLVYLVYPPLITLNLYEFHPVAFVVPCFLYMFYFYQRRRFLLTLLFLLLAMSCQENIATLAIGFAFYVLLDRRKGKWFWVPLCAGVAYFIAAFLIIMPHFNQGTIQFHRLYGPLGDSVPGIMKNIILHPLKAAGIMAAPHKLGYVVSLLAPAGFLSLLNPAALIPCLPVLAQRLLSVRAAETTISYHYQAEFIPFVFISAVGGLQRVLKLKVRLLRPLAAALLVCFPVLSFVFTGVPWRVFEPIHVSQDPATKAVTAARNRMLRAIRPEASVLATFEFLPRLSNRRALYSLHHVYTGAYTLSDTPYPVPPDIDTIVMNTRDRLTFTYEGFYNPGHYRNLQALVTNGSWSVAYTCGTDLVLVKVKTPSAGLPLEPVELPDGINRNVRQFYGDSTELLGFRLDTQSTDGMTPLTLYWKTPPLVESEFDILLTLEESGNILYSGELSPGHRIWPPQSWDPGSVVADHHGLQLTAPVNATNTRATVLVLGIR